MRNGARDPIGLVLRDAHTQANRLGVCAPQHGADSQTHSFRSAAGGEKYWLVKTSSAFGRFLKS